MTGTEIIKSLECCAGDMDCPKCPKNNEGISCVGNLISDTYKLVTHLQEENDDLFYKLRGVMLFVDKWLDDNELNQDEVNRASTMREKTLQIIEKQQTEIEKLKERRILSNDDKEL